MRPVLASPVIRMKMHLNRALVESIASIYNGTLQQIFAVYLGLRGALLPLLWTFNKENHTLLLSRFNFSSITAYTSTLPFHPRFDKAILVPILRWFVQRNINMEVYKHTERALCRNNNYGKYSPRA